MCFLKTVPHPPPRPQPDASLPPSDGMTGGGGGCSPPSQESSSSSRDVRAFANAELFPHSRSEMRVDPARASRPTADEWRRLLRYLVSAANDDDDGVVVREFRVVEDDDDEYDTRSAMTSARIRALLETCPHVTRLTVPCRHVPSILSQLQRYDRLRELEVNAIPLQERRTTDSAPSVADLLIRHCLGGGRRQHHPLLERLVLRGAVEEAEEYATLSADSLLTCLEESPSLKKLELKAMEIVSTASVTPRRLGRALRDNTSLELFRCRCGRVPEAYLLELGRALWDENRTLYHVDIGSLQGVTDAVAQTFTTVMACNTVFRSFECNLNSISNFNFLSLKNMFCMDISDNHLGDEGALLIANCMPGASIERLNFADNGISRVGASAIAWGMGQCKNLNICNICDNPVKQETDPSTIQSPLAQAVLRKVQASPAYSHGFLGMLCAGLKDHPSMAHLNLASTGLDDEDGPLLALVVRISRIRQLYLGRNGLGDETCGHLYSVLGDDQADLTTLSMPLNSFTARGFYTLWYGILRTNSKLRSLQIGLRAYSIYGVSRGQRDLDIGLRLNRAGRIRLLREEGRATLGEWLECLFAVTDDVDCSYALLRENPSLCTAAGVAQ